MLVHCLYSLTDASSPNEKSVWIDGDAERLGVLGESFRERSVEVTDVIAYMSWIRNFWYLLPYIFFTDTLV